jgi:hypothetical protein
LASGRGVVLVSHGCDQRISRRECGWKKRASRATVYIHILWSAILYEDKFFQYVKANEAKYRVAAVKVGYNTIGLLLHPNRVAKGKLKWLGSRLIAIRWQAPFGRHNDMRGAF